MLERSVGEHGYDNGSEMMIMMVLERSDGEGDDDDTEMIVKMVIWRIVVLMVSRARPR